MPRTRVGAGVFVLGYSRLGLDRLGPEEPYNSLRGNVSLQHVEDAIIGATAQVDGLRLVTHDKRLRRRAAEAGVVVLDFEEFRALMA